MLHPIAVREPGWRSKCFPHLCHGERWSTLIQIAGYCSATIGVEERRRGLEAGRRGAWAPISKLTPSTLCSLKPYDAYATISSPGTLSAGQGDGGHEELRVRMVGL